MNHQVICPVCKTKYNKEVTVCDTCGFTDRLGISPLWIDYKDAESWTDAVLMPYRKYWGLARKYSELSFVDRKSVV